MDFKEIGACTVVVIGGVAYGVSGGLGDALSSDVKHVSEVPYEERADYMGDIVSTFSESFETYIVQSQTYDYVGYSEFGARPSRATFTEIVAPRERLPSKEVQGIKAQMGPDFCKQDEMTMFTDKGWSYSFKLEDGNDRVVVSIFCRAEGSKLAPKNQAIS